VSPSRQPSKVSGPPYAMHSKIAGVLPLLYRDTNRHFRTPPRRYLYLLVSRPKMDMTWGECRRRVHADSVKASLGVVSRASRKYARRLAEFVRPFPSIGQSFASFESRMPALDEGADTHPSNLPGPCPWPSCMHKGSHRVRRTNVDTFFIPLFLFLHQEALPIFVLCWR
jgi:hypothetical protein